MHGEIKSDRLNSVQIMGEIVRELRANVISESMELSSDGGDVYTYTHHQTADFLTP